MKGLRLNSRNNLVVEEIESGKLESGWVRINVNQVSICRSGLTSIIGKLTFTKFPSTRKHEFSGIITRKSIGRSARSRGLLKEREGETWRDLPTFQAGSSHKVESYPRDISSREAA